MFPEVSLPLPLHLLVRLTTLLESTGDGRDVCNFVTSLIEEWLTDAAQEASAAGRAKKKSDDNSGYLWKEVFLPNGTQLRVVGGLKAEVRNGELLHHGRATSPNRLAENVRGLQSHNAWRSVAVQRPGDPGFQRAWRLRREAMFKVRQQVASSNPHLQRAEVKDRRRDQHPLDRYSVPFDEPSDRSGGHAPVNLAPEATMIASRERRKLHARRCTDTILDD